MTDDARPDNAMCNLLRPLGLFSPPPFSSPLLSAPKAEGRDQVGVKCQVHQLQKTASGRGSLLQSRSGSSFSLSLYEDPG